MLINWISLDNNSEIKRLGILPVGKYATLISRGILYYAGQCHGLAHDKKMKTFIMQPNNENVGKEKIGFCSTFCYIFYVYKLWMKI